MKSITESDLEYLKKKAQKGIELCTSVIRRIDQVLDAEQPETPVEVEEPETPIDEEEPVEDDPIEEEEPETEEPDSPISNFKVLQVSNNMVKATWIPNIDKLMDIEYYRPSVDREWKHSVQKYTQKYIPTQKGFVFIGISEPINEALFRPIIAGEVISDPVGITQPDPDPKPIEENKEPVQDEEPTEPTPDPDEGDVEIALVFHKGLNIDAWLNGKKVPKERGFDYRVPNPAGETLGVKLIRTTPLKTFEFNPEQVDLNSFNIKIVTRNPDNDLTKINTNHSQDDPKFWGNTGNINPGGVIYSARGDTIDRGKDEDGNKILYPDPLFYKGWRKKPVQEPDNREFDQGWSVNRKIVINLGV